MSARHRTSRPSATPSTARSQALPRATQNATPMPQYVVPTAPLNQKATTSLERLPTQSQYAKKLKELQDKAVEHLTSSTAAINERNVDRKRHAGTLKERARRLESGQSTQTPSSSQRNADENADMVEQGSQTHKRKAVEDAQQENVYVTEFERKAGTATDQAEEKLRDLIDLKAKSEARNKALSEVSGNVVRGEGRVAPTQSTLGASQFRTQQNLDDDNEDAPTSVLISLRSKVEEQDLQYNSLTMRKRYAQHNDYVGFKGSVHEAIHQDDGTRLPHYTRWFPAEPGDATDAQMEGSGSPEEDADSDIEIAREVVSFKCPLTMREFEDPLTSPCNHNFEAAAIKEHISRSQEREGGGHRGDRIIRCPISGCETRFTEKNLRVDKIIRRRIQRAQERARQAAEEGLGDDSFADTGRPRAVSVVDDGSRLSTAPPIKPEPRSSMAARHASAVPPSTPTLSRSGMDVDDEDEDEDYDEDEDED